MTIIRSKTFIQVALTSIFLTVLLIFSFSTILSPKKDISLQEKRQLAQFPQFSWTMSSMANWPKSLDTYLKDHFFYREKLVFLNALLRVKLFHRSPTFVVLAGKEGWYFFMGDWALHDYFGNFDKNVDALHSWEKLITLRQQRMQNMEGNYLVAVVPNKESVYPEYLPGRFEGKAGTTMLDALKKRMCESPMADHFLDLGEPLQRAKLTGQIYYKTDSHWNHQGAYFAYSAIIERIKHWYPQVIPLPETRFKKEFDSHFLGGDLVFLMGLSGAIVETTEIWKIQTRCAEQMERDVSSEMLPAGKLLKANGCPAGAALRVLVISDSFGDGPLREYLSETFQEVVYSRELSFPDLQNYITQYQPGLVLDLRVGRYIPKVMSPGPDEKITD